MEAVVKEANKSENQNDHAHIAWLVIKESSARIQQSHKEIVETLNQHNVPVIVVVTESIDENTEFADAVKDVVSINSVPK